MPKEIIEIDLINNENPQVDMDKSSSNNENPQVDTKIKLSKKIELKDIYRTPYLCAIYNVTFKGVQKIVENINEDTKTIQIKLLNLGINLIELKRIVKEEGAVEIEGNHLTSFEEVIEVLPVGRTTAYDAIKVTTFLELCTEEQRAEFLSLSTVKQKVLARFEISKLSQLQEELEATGDKSLAQMSRSELEKLYKSESKARKSENRRWSEAQVKNEEIVLHQEEIIKRLQGTKDYTEQLKVWMNEVYPLLLKSELLAEQVDSTLASLLEIKSEYQNTPMWRSLAGTLHKVTLAITASWQAKLHLIDEAVGTEVSGIKQSEMFQYKDSLKELRSAVELIYCEKEWRMEALRSANNIIAAAMNKPQNIKLPEGRPKKISNRGKTDEN